MRTGVAAALMTLAAACLGPGHREWARAMQGEFDAAEGGRLSFALGCLVAALGELPRHAAGRLALADQTLAAAILVPVAGIQFLCAVGFVAPFSPAGGVCELQIAGSAQTMFFAHACLATQPARLCIWALIGIANLRLAWFLAEGDWPGVTRAALLATAATLTDLIFDAVLLLVDGRSLVQAATLFLELAALGASARLHGRLPDPIQTSDQPA